MSIPSCKVVRFPKVTNFTGRASGLYFFLGSGKHLRENGEFDETLAQFVSQ